LRSWAPERARTYLARYRGVGPKTAAFTLMRAAGMDLFPLNGGILRLCRRLGLLTGAESDDQAHRRMARWVPAGEGEAAHVAMVRHARRVCRKTRPRCGECAARELCEAARDGSAGVT
jgi:endonuclease-3